MPDTPQFELPFREGAPEVEQDSLDDVAACVETLMRTPLGFLEENPDYGISDPVFEEGDVNRHELQSAISQWEERADAEIEANPDALDAFVQRVDINVRVRSDG